MTDSPFQRVLGAAFDSLPEPVRRLHGLTRPVTAAGTADIDAAPGLLPRAICAIAGLPTSGRGTPASVTFTPDGCGNERWVRRFGRRRYASTMTTSAAHPGGVVEHFGPFTLVFRLTPLAAGLSWRVSAWKLLGIGLPRWSTPRIECLEAADGERFTFDIDVTFPVIGPLIRYRGWLLPQPE